MGIGPSPRVFLRKDVILGELACEVVQGCESKGVRGDFWCGMVRGEVIRIARCVNTKECIRW
jgi:hypothetical protein